MRPDPSPVVASPTEGGATASAVVPPSPADGLPTAAASTVRVATLTLNREHPPERADPATPRIPAGLVAARVAPIGGVPASAAVGPLLPPGAPVLAQPGEVLPSLDARLSACGEDAEWFRRLPPAMQAQIRAGRAQIAERAVERHRTWKQSYGYGALRGGVVFLLTHLMFGFGGLVGIAVATAVGAALGALWTQFDAGPLKSALSAAPVYAVVWFAFGPDGGELLVVAVFFAELIVMGLASAAGTMREFRQSDGQE